MDSNPRPIKPRAPEWLLGVFIILSVAPLARHAQAEEHSGAATIWRTAHVRVLDSGTGSAVSGATVEVRASVGFSKNWAEARAVSGERGEATLRFPWFSAGTEPRIFVEREGYFTSSATPAAAGETSITLTSLANLQPVHLRIHVGEKYFGLGFDHATPLPTWLETATLTLSSFHRTFHWRRVLVLEEGARLRVSCPAGRVTAILACPGRSPVYAQANIGSRGRKATITFEEPPIARHVIIGRVVEEGTQSPLGGAQVSIRSFRDIEVISAEDGTFRLEGLSPRDFMNGIVPVTCMREDHEFLISGVSVFEPMGDTLVGRVLLQGIRTVKKELYQLRHAEDGKPAQRGWVVTEYNGRTQVFRAGSDGRVAVPQYFHRKSIPIVAFDDSHVGAINAGDLSSDGSIHMFALARLQRRVAMEDPPSRTAAPFVEVLLHQERGDDQLLWSLPVTEDGVCAGPVPMSSESVVSLGSISHYPIRWSGASVLGSESMLLLLTRSHLATTCTGVLRDESGSPMRAVKIQLSIAPTQSVRGRLPEVYTVETNEAGTFRLSGPQGPYTISFPGDQQLSLVTPKEAIEFVSGTQRQVVVRRGRR